MVKPLDQQFALLLVQLHLSGVVHEDKGHKPEHPVQPDMALKMLDGRKGPGTRAQTFQDVASIGT
jgi:hypothetical protein